MENIVPYIGTIIGWVVVLAIVATIAFFALGSKANRAGKVAGLASIVVILGLAAFITSAHLGSASFQRSKKAAVSEYNAESLTRELKVVSETGEVIYETTGQFDIEYEDNRLRWIDEKGKVHLVYLGNSATVIVNEK